MSADLIVYLRVPLPDLHEVRISCNDPAEAVWLAAGALGDRLHIPALREYPRSFVRKAVVLDHRGRELHRYESPPGSGPAALLDDASFALTASTGLPLGERMDLLKTLAQARDEILTEQRRSVPYDVLQREVEQLVREARITGGAEFLERIRKAVPHLGVL